MSVSFLSLKDSNASYADELKAAVGRVIDSGVYILGPEVDAFERAFSAYCKLPFCIGVGNGFDALSLIFRGYKEMGKLHDGDEVILPANTFIASLLAVTENRLRPVLVEPDPVTYNLDPVHVAKAVTPNTRAIMAVHLYGQLAAMPELVEFSRSHGLILVEDCAQAHGAVRQGTTAGAFGAAAAFSFYPTKGLGALGDAGAIVTGDAALAGCVAALRNYGSEAKYHNLYRGVNSRLDEIQATMLRVKLSYLDAEIAARRRVAHRYLSEIRNSRIQLPEVAAGGASHVWHLFVVRCVARDALQNHLQRSGVSTQIHYPIPLHRQRAYEDLRNLSLPVTEALSDELLSLPIGSAMSEDDVGKVIIACNLF